MYVCGGGEKKERHKGTWVVGKKKKEIKKNKEMGSGVYMYGGKKGGVVGKKGKWKRKKKKKLKGKKLNWFYLYVHFVWCKV
jgi:hypothetical protein